MSKYKSLSFESTLPLGWISDYLKKDLINGFVGHLDELVPTLISQDDIYGAHRRTADFKTPDLGTVDNGDLDAPQYKWWNSETQSNWLDGFYRSSVLVRDHNMRTKAETYLQKYLNTQDDNGYIGIYKSDIRFAQGTENGELWAQATLFRALIAYYEQTHNADILFKIEKAAQLTMQSYPIGTRPFCTDGEPIGTVCCGIGHGLAVVDVFYTLFQLTGKNEYLDYCVFLYDNYSAENKLEPDIQLHNLKNPEYKLCGHSVHTAEHLRALAIAAYYSKNPEHKEALQRFLDKMKNCLCPSGALIGDEWISKNGANASFTGYEYCTIHELLDSYSLLLRLSGKMEWADKIETLLFNAGMGAHHPEKSSIAYLKSDNSYKMASAFQSDQPHCNYINQTRYKYSPTHQDAAVCCVPNAGRIFPYYINSMFLQQKDGFCKVLYGPSTMTGYINGTKVNITEISNYPFTCTMSFIIKVENPLRMKFSLRKPSWWKSYSVTDANAIEQDNLIVIDRIWNGETKFDVEFVNETKAELDVVGDIYFTHGVFVLSLPIQSEEKIIKEYSVSGFCDTEYYPLKNSFYNYSVSEECKNVILNAKPKFDGNCLLLNGTLHNCNSNKKESVKLISMGHTILRRVTFPPSKKEI